MGLDWKGDEIKRRMDMATRIGINQVMAQCVGGSKRDHPFTNRTGTAEQSIRIAMAAEQRGNKTTGIWGSVMNAYFKYLELGTTAMRGATFSSKRLKQDSKGPSWRGGSWAPTLVPQAKIFYKGLTYRIEAAFMRGL